MANLSDYIRLFRPSQWYKNLLIPAVGIFSFQILELTIYGYLLLGFILACGISGTNYIFNDLMDIADDRLHPQKRNRPIAAGSISKRNAMILGVGILLISIICSYLLSFWFGIIMSIFFLISQLYTFVLKKIIFVDVLSISVNFILRGIGGFMIINSCTILISPPTLWSFWAVFILALFLALSKRKADLQLLEQENSLNNRFKSSLYPKKLLDQLIILISGIFLMGYYFYVIDTDTTGGYLLMTIPVATYLMFRYLYLLDSDKKPLLTANKWLKDPGMILGCIVVFILFLTVKFLENYGIL
jgi:4-hydroxybenzoate polyprenyltransferase